MITIVFLWEWRTSLPQQRLPSAFTEVLVGSHNDGIVYLENYKYASAIKIEKGYWRWGGQRGGCLLTRLVEVLDHSYHPFCLGSSLQHWMPRKEARKPPNMSWHFPETASELWPTWFCSWANAGILPQTVPDKIDSKLYHTGKWRVKQKWSCIPFTEAVFLHLRNPEWSKRISQISMVCSRTFDKHFAIV